MSLSKNVGIVGFGEMGKRVGHELMVVTGGMVKIAGVVEPDDKKYEQGCEYDRCKPRRYSSIAEMLEHENIDGLVISSPNSHHLENLKELGENFSIPVWLEKPLDSSLERVCDVLRFSERYKGPIVVNHVLRHAPINVKAKELVASGAIGEICSVNFVQNVPGAGMYHSFRRTMAESGGMFIEKATHDLDLMLSLIEAKPVRVAAIARRQAFGGDKPGTLHCSECDERATCKESVINIHYRYGHTEMLEVKGSRDLCVYAKVVDVPDNEVCMMEFDNGVFGTYTERYFVPPSCHDREYELVGLNGIMKMSLYDNDKPGHGKISVYPRYGTPEDVYKFSFDYRGRIHCNGDGNVARHFYQIMLGKACPFTTVRQAFVAEVMGFAALLASKQEKFINILDIVPDDLKDIWNKISY